MQKSIYFKYIKRPLDVVLSLFALIVLSPLLLTIAILVKIKLGSPVIFKQDRPGKDEKIFTMYKFRTMTDKKDKDGNLFSDKDRLTKFGKLLRKTSLDELPELWNILKGEMSIVGPRPLLIEYLLLYNNNQKRRHEVRPGLTGFAQVYGRNELKWEEKFDYDVKYIDKITFLLDLKIILRTVLKVLKQEGIHDKKTFTAKPFKGTKKECVERKSI